MNNGQFDLDVKKHWCPGCGNFIILKTLKKTLENLDLTPQDLVIVSGIGQAGKTPHFMRTNYFNGLHGRALPLAMAAKALNPKMVVLAISGDGCMYSEGGNHLIHAIRRNIDVTCIVHNNMVYGLTKGQASPTSQAGFTTKVQLNGVTSQSFNPISFAVGMNATFVARANAADKEETQEILTKAINHKGFALVDIFQPCVTFNKTNTYSWFKENSYYLEDDYDSEDRETAFSKACEKTPYPLGVIFQQENMPTFHEKTLAYSDKKKTPLIDRERNLTKIEENFFT
ncbi:MAG: thiamine pyrophosphate-dependent enzyme [Asgard group archaeon]|nr:thiamine pyrophosphate-dependent enzyme [Asgard group archaeon]